MQAPKPDPASFRDPAGRIYLDTDAAYRTVMPYAAATFAQVWESGIIRRMADAGRIIAAEKIAVPPSFTPAPSFLLKHPLLPLVSYPYEWPFAMLKAAALAHLELQLELLAQGFTLSDASAFNMQFVDTRPLHIDTLSIIPYRDGEPWRGYAQFMRHFVHPLLLEAYTGVPFQPLWRGTMDGIPGDMLLRLLPLRARMRPSVQLHVALPARAGRSRRTGNVSVPQLSKHRLIGLLKHLHTWIDDLCVPPAKTPWGDYAAEHSYAPASQARKREIVAAFVRSCAPDTLIDIGCNRGEYAMLAAQHGAARVVALDGDVQALEHAYRSFVQQQLPITTLLADLMNPAPAQGWRAQERTSLLARLKGDALLALALLHHLVIGGNVPLAEAVEFLVSLAPQGLIEFVPKSDPQVAHMLALREDIFSDYEEGTFRAALRANADIVSEEILPGSGRILFHYRRDGA